MSEVEIDRNECSEACIQILSMRKKKYDSKIILLRSLIK